ncbi:MAG: YceI family protein [Pseudomonadota bacterium]
MRSFGLFLRMLALPALLSACAPAPPVAPTAATAADAGAAPPAAYSQQRMPGQQVWRIDPQSLVAITVRRSGALARLGHDHVVAARQIDGYAVTAAAPAASGGATGSAIAGRADFRFRLDRMTVDEADLRAVAGLDSVPSADAIAGTRHNMLERVLDAAQFPYVQVHAEQADASSPVQADITLHGVTRRYAIPATIALAAGGTRLNASGTLTLKQSDFGIVPFSVLGGALAVQDQLELRFEIGAVQQ